MNVLSEPAMTSEPFDSPLRCTRCGGIALPATVGRTPDGALVFGWCLGCMAEVGCIGNDESVPLSVEPPSKAHSYLSSSPIRTPVSVEVARSRTTRVLAIAFIAWGVMLCSWCVVLFDRQADPSATLNRVRYSPRIALNPFVLGVAGGIIILFGLLQLYLSTRPKKTIK